MSSDDLSALRARLAALYGVEAARVLPVRGWWHAVALAFRLAARRGGTRFTADVDTRADQVGALYGLVRADSNANIALVQSPSRVDGRVLTLSETVTSLMLVDESFIEVSTGASLAADAADGIMVYRDLGDYGMTDPCGALIADALTIETVTQLVEPEAIATSVVRAALTAIAPARLAAHERRFKHIIAERARLADALIQADGLAAVSMFDGPFVFVTPRDLRTTKAALKRFDVLGEWVGERFRIDVATPADNDRALSAFDVVSPRPPGRRAEIVRETLETRIVAAVDLESEGAHIETGVGFFDHMMAQVAAHGGFAIDLHCQGDLHVDAHHTIEDCSLALGQALKEALGARRGIARYGFVLPMDEAEAKVSIDLGGRPYLVFDAAFKAPLIGAYPTEMTEHVFRSLAQSLGASIHVAVTGENDHHMTEACFKALGRALRQAVRVEGAALPSTKGVIA